MLVNERVIQLDVMTQQKIIMNSDVEPSLIHLLNDGTPCSTNVWYKIVNIFNVFIRLLAIEQTIVTIIKEMKIAIHIYNENII